MLEQEPLQQSVPETAPRPYPQPGRNPWAIPGAIVLSALLIAGAIVFTGSRQSNFVQTGGNNEGVTPEIEVAPVTKDDHILGNPNAPVMLVEYSDYDCPFCRIFHDTMTRIMAEYGKDGKVAWVYRHFPIVQLHPNAPKISEAAYCVEELGGNDAFWKFNDEVNTSREIEYNADGSIKGIAPTNMLKISDFAVAAGVDKAKFDACYQSGKYADEVAADVGEAAKAGARGTPHTILMVGGELGTINGAQPYEVVKQMIDTVLSQTGQ